MRYSGAEILNEISYKPRMSETESVVLNEKSYKTAMATDTGRRYMPAKINHFW